MPGNLIVRCQGAPAAVTVDDHVIADPAPRIQHMLDRLRKREHGVMKTNAEPLMI